MGNCQAIDNASLAIQQPCGRVDKAYWPLPASYVMKTNPGYHVALLLTTTLYPPSTTTADSAPLRVTRIKLLRPTDTLVLGHTYRLVSSQEVMKGVWAKKHAKMQKKKQSEASSEVINSSAESTLKNKNKLVIKHDRPTKTSSKSSSVRPRGWHPSLHSITETAS
ncbi:hypothetical protein DCAR_0729992 [Daucus carota subsp. sativus]|uniref:Uncharacterized protein n=1 Tax=Daucus carota subsp. sativus TaxID=79200 RepID=A0A161X910_DAUCS|nr:PREDICTED: uncharacterized protein LOC108194196 [Daucus carota subsp. sativus]WOH10523.1 hypothetical protein DCAR_0729992 [Daucus carota subsp. sativus]